MVESFFKSPQGDEQGEKHTEPNILLNDIWALEAIQGIALVADNMPRPQLEIHLKDNMLIGNDGCNGYFSNITALNHQRIVLGPIGSTQKFCEGMSIPDHFHQNLQLIASYQVQNLRLRFFSKDGHELLLFRKID